LLVDQITFTTIPIAVRSYTARAATTPQVRHKNKAVRGMGTHYLRSFSDLWESVWSWLGVQNPGLSWPGTFLPISIILWFVCCFSRR